MINEARMIEEFFQLVQINSETKNEANIAAYLKDKFQQLGLEVIEDNAKEQTGHGANNLICNLKGKKSSGEPIFFSSHMDTVTPGEDIKPKIEDNYIVSDGT